MSSLREVKERIASVRSTLKITSAMKLVASSKLRRAQRAIEALRPYEAALQRILDACSGLSRSHDHGRPWSQETSPEYASPVVAGGSKTAVSAPENGENVIKWSKNDEFSPAPTVVMAFSGNSSMCGAFNGNAIKKTLEFARQLEGPVEFVAFGRKMAEALRKAGGNVVRDCSGIVAKPDYASVAALSDELRKSFSAGEISGAVLVYNHFVNNGRQEVVVEDYLQASCGFTSPESSPAYATQQEADDELFILEPSRAELLETLQPQVLAMKLYAALLDSAAAEHAARMIAMQTASDNAESLLAELTLEYNKGRQQKITSEILDIAGGSLSR